MTILALISGILLRPPEQRTAKTGRLFVSATIRVNDGDGSQFVRIVAFSESAQSELLRLYDGDFLSAQGPLKAEVYEKAGEHRISLSLIANHVLALRQPPRESKPLTADPPAAPDTRPRQERLAGVWTSERDGPNDSIDFGGDA